MKVVIAPDSYKESLSALEVATQIEAGFREVFPDWSYITVPMADGGEGTVEALVAATGGRVVERIVSGPLGTPVLAFFGVTGDGRTAVIEMAAAAGLALVPAAARDPLRSSTAGVGELILAALDAGTRHLIIGLGGSATNDGGAGMAQALGALLLDAHGTPIGAGGTGLAALARIQTDGLDRRLQHCRIEVACDVDNPLLGPTGASAVFGPQKGATPDMVRQLEANLQHYADLLQRDLGLRLHDLPGGGAAGGLGAALVAVLGAQLRPGVEIVAQALGLEALIAQADLVITGEGRLDRQSLHGKTPLGVAQLAQRHAKPVIAIAGGLGNDAGLLHAHGIAAMFAVVHRPCTVEQALAEAAGNVRRAARNVAAALQLGRALTEPAAAVERESTGRTVPAGSARL
ncbi:glycerate kinase [Xanthomonas cucurbitae]|uniref:Glycerate kinase n=1 Tax=Xanthomonas cucurbitae TaxID=56453 RepID=A0A2S7DRY9_9XANT|nr:glycerate kinase [Xanthomonas cucurbitae]PPU76591.1 glycerate kinase [Xanthomonas cucurbitae]WDM67760.1 glycerate kinase [Xanthomonas cucurbitae]WDM71635.1 glycerate kinase [Xanthomonas cucurbitae]WDM79190.1 glycerate kinase [Xanthomonas cucurbitae]WDM82875.1 glycerate kinase [Xanthomonas cucurbitae]